MTEVEMSEKSRPKEKPLKKSDEQKGQSDQQDSGIGQHIPYDKGKKNTQNNPAGQGNEGDDVMPAGRETPG
jgi:hypothetical protein